ncbi:MAG TPA: alpha/beta hydrolase [Bacillota bacterium]|nr:alpha/beta hydrolase [Bacillota bacterium]
MPCLLWEDVPPGYRLGVEDEEIPQFTPYLVSNNPTQSAVIIFPGGGYHHRAKHEGEPVALWLNKLGISAFVVDYRVAPAKYPFPILDGKRAVRYVRTHGEQWGIAPDKIGVLGFSAGGHLAATVGTQFDTGNPESPDPVEQTSSRPDTLILCYPVISFDEYRHAGSVANLLGDDPNPELIRKMSLQYQVSGNTPPTFLWHTANDASVPVENSLLFAGALSQHQVPFELHIFPEGRHGLGLAAEQPTVAVWHDLCATWLRKIGFAPS